MDKNPIKDSRITVSMMKTFLNCQYKCYLKYELRLRSPLPSKPLRIGIAVHEGLHAFFLAYSSKLKRVSGSGASGMGSQCSKPSSSLWKEIEALNMASPP